MIVMAENVCVHVHMQFPYFENSFYAQTLWGAQNILISHHLFDNFLGKNFKVLRKYKFQFKQKLKIRQKFKEFLWNC